MAVGRGFVLANGSWRPGPPSGKRNGWKSAFCCIKGKHPVVSSERRRSFSSFSPYVLEDGVKGDAQALARE